MNPRQVLRCGAVRLVIIPAWLRARPTAPRWFSWLRRWRATKLSRFLHTKLH